MTIYRSAYLKYFCIFNIQLFVHYITIICSLFNIQLFAAKQIQHERTGICAFECGPADALHRRASETVRV